MKQLTFSWPDGRTGAFTTSWDDGTVYDRKLVAILNRYGIKGTWNLNSGQLGKDARQSGWKDYISADEVRDLYQGHEVAVHTVNHPFLWRSPDDMVRAEVLHDRAALERLVGYPVQGMALPFGGPDDPRVRSVIASCGVLYLRPVAQINTFELPADFMYWRTTCHQGADCAALWEKFLTSPAADKLFFLWGHSYEFEDGHNWDRPEEFCRLAGQRPDIWYATNMEIYEYVAAWRGLRCGIEMAFVKNPSAVTVWYRVGGELRSIAPGAVVAL